MTYEDFIQRKTQVGADHGFDPIWMPDSLFDFQQALTEWSLRKGRAAIFADCGLGKTPMQLVWAENVVRQTNGRVLILTPLAVGAQTVREGEKFGVECSLSRDGKWPDDKRIIVTNYEKLHLFDAADFSGCVCDESSILKNYAGKTRDAITIFMHKIKHRLLCTATPAPNDFMELGTSSEALGCLSRSEMLSMFFTHDSSSTQKWRLKGHAEKRFWQWVTSWGAACRQPSDLGYDNDGFVIPPLNTREHIVKASTPKSGYLFDMPAVTLDEQRDERRRSQTERCAMAADLVNNNNEPAVCWGYLNAECNTLNKMIPESEQVSGNDSDDKKEEILTRFKDGDIRVLVTKPVIGAWGLNWQHCAHQTFFPSHSFEQFYQAVRRSWRFGQKKPVVIDVVASEGESGVVKNIERKAEQASNMYDNLIKMMQSGDVYKPKTDKKETKLEVPEWI